jgi:DNA-binding IclR family transcriptional regulator
VLILKRQGLFLSEISARTGLHEGSIRRILYDLARRMAVGRRTAKRAPAAIRPEY